MFTLSVTLRVLRGALEEVVTILCHPESSTKRSTMLMVRISSSFVLGLLESIFTRFHIIDCSLFINSQLQSQYLPQVP